MKPSRIRFAETAAMGLIATVVVCCLIAAIGEMPRAANGLASEVDLHLSLTGVQNPVTAVLINFRGYDTFLELAVLVLAVWGVKAIGSDAAHDREDSTATPPSIVLTGFVRVVGPVVIVIAGYLLWVGGHSPGGAFQAGAVLAALGILLDLATIEWSTHISERSERCLQVAAVAGFLVVGTSSLFLNRTFLEFPPELASTFTLAIESAATLSIALILIALYRGGGICVARLLPPPVRERSK